MVQMKEKSRLEETVTVKSFISHMVQMKVELSLKTVVCPSPLYPTWFR